jgi:hypothetical protein
MRAEAKVDGCVRNIGSSKGDRFVCLPMGILEGGVTLKARRSLPFEVLNPLTGVVVSNLALNAGSGFALPQGPGAAILKGTFEDDREPKSPGHKAPSL